MDILTGVVGNKVITSHPGLFNKFLKELSWLACKASKVQCIHNIMA